MENIIVTTFHSVFNNGLILCFGSQRTAQPTNVTFPITFYTIPNVVGTISHAKDGYSSFCVSTVTQTGLLVGHSGKVEIITMNYFIT